MADQQVTIEGSVTPTAELPRGERKTVLYTDRIKRLVARGYVTIINGPTDVNAPAQPAKAPAKKAAKAAPEPTPEPEPMPDESAAQPTGRQAGPAGTEPIESGEKPTGGGEDVTA